MALQDLERGNGFALIDPHGDLVERIAARIPQSGRTDVLYFSASTIKPRETNRGRHAVPLAPPHAACGVGMWCKNPNCSYIPATNKIRLPRR